MNENRGEVSEDLPKGTGIIFAICIGTYHLLNFARLNLAYARQVFGEDAPIIVYDGRSENSEAIEALAAEYGAAYLGERVNRGHFAGDIQASVTAIAFAQAHECDVAIKLNQRTVLLSPEIPALLAREFADGETTILTPGRYPSESILDDSSRFHARFTQSVDVLCFRASAWDAQGVADRYKQQWTTGTSKFDTYSEVFWANEVQRIGAAHKTAGWLTAHKTGEPFRYLRKIQNREEDYRAAARAIGLPADDYPTEEWSALKRCLYRPAPRA